MGVNKSDSVKKYTYFNALLVGIVSGGLALGINFLIAENKINHQFEALFAPVAVGVILSIFNFKPLSKLSIFLLPPVYALLGFAPVLGPFLISSIGFDANSMGSTMGLLVQAVPFFLSASFVYKWYVGLAGKKSFISYTLFSIVTVVVGFLLFKDGLEFELIMSSYLGISAFLLSRIHVGTILG